MNIKSKVIVYLPFYDEEFFCVEKQNFENNILPEHFNLLFIGRLVKTKGIFDVLSVAKLLKAKNNIKIYIAGKGSEEKSIKEIVRENNLNNVILLGYIARKNLYALFRHGALSIIPSYREGLNKVVIESIISGVPVIASDTGGIKDWVIPGKTGYLVEPGDVQGFADKVTFFYENKDKLAELKNKTLDYKNILLNSEMTLKNLFGMYF